MNYIIGVIKQAEFAIANSPMSKMMDNVVADKDKDNKDEGTEVTAEQARAEVKNLIAETVAEELGKFDFVRSSRPRRPY